MKIKQLVEEAAILLKSQGYTKATVYISYVRFWNGLARSTDEDIEFSESVVTNYVISKYGQDIMSENPSYLPPKEYRIYRAFKSLQEFYLTQSISGSSMTGASVRQVLPEYENSVLESYIQHIDGLEYSTKSKRTAYGIVHHYLLVCPLAKINDSGMLEISKALGHSSVDTTKIYAKVDTTHLRLCELEVPTNGK